MVSRSSRKLVIATGLCALYAMPAMAADLVFTAPPRGAEENESDVYQPIAEYLSAAIGKKIVYEHSDNWLTYQYKMQKGSYDLVFDGPHFLSWRMIKLNHEPLVKFPGKLAFVVIARKDNDRINEVKDLAGRTVCGMAPPNLATLTMYSLFENPARQPLIVEVQSFKQAYQDVLANKCAAAVLRDAAFNKLDKDKNAAKVLFHSKGVPNQAFSAGPRFTAEDKAKMVKALLAPEAKVKLAKFLERFNMKDKELLAASRAEFEGIAVLLKDTYGFDVTQTSAIETKVVTKTDK